MKEYEIKFEEGFLKDLKTHKKLGSKIILKKISSLIDELRLHPYTGTGHPEELKGSRQGEWSRRINKKHRLIYTVDDEKIIVYTLSAYGHYGDK